MTFILRVYSSFCIVKDQMEIVVKLHSRNLDS